jgi:zinc D-Ala-D-Ala dipeptidase
LNTTPNLFIPRFKAGSSKEWPAEPASTIRCSLKRFLLTGRWLPEPKSAQPLNRRRGNSIRLRRLGVTLFLAFFVAIAAAAHAGKALPEGFVDVKEVVPTIQVEPRYATENNFVGSVVDGYLAPRCILTREAANALKQVQEDLMRFGLGLKIYDGYRPQQAVDHFVRWAKDPDDAVAKSRYYPDVDKHNLFREGYISSRSGHSRGSTVDLTIVSMTPPTLGAELDMGTPFDFFGPESWPDNPSLAPEQRAHRLLLRSVMTGHGFKPFEKEWWHFTLEDEPYPERYFNFPVQ